MSAFKVAFDALPWQKGRPGVRWKVYCEGTRQLRLVEFETSDGFEPWCQQGHIGYVLAGGLQIDVNGQVLTFAAGDGIFLPAGTASQHRAVSITPGTRLVMVEDA
jgi:quercetin dioxygenase-like cupin family protein